MHDLWPPMLLSIRVALVATLAAAVMAIPLAYVLARKQFFGRSLIEVLITLPLVLPPTVIGYGLVVLVGARGVFGKFIETVFGTTVMFHWSGAVIAAAVVALPLLVLPTKSAFAAVDRELEDVSRLMGAGPFKIFWHVSLPLARRGISSGLLLAFARSLGEFGATVMVLGDIPGRQTLPISIYADSVVGEMDRALPAVLALTGLSLLVLLIYNRLPVSWQD